MYIAKLFKVTAADSLLWHLNVRIIIFSLVLSMAPCRISILIRRFTVELVRKKTRIFKYPRIF